MFAAGLADASYVATWKDMDRAVVEILAASGVRGDQLVQASDEWEDMRLLARDRSGETAADERLKQSRSSMMRRRADRENAGSHAERNAGEASPHCVRFRRRLQPRAFRQCRKRYSSASRWDYKAIAPAD